jgi:hypothetical protein
VEVARGARSGPFKIMQGECRGNAGAGRGGKGSKFKYRRVGNVGLCGRDEERAFV